MEVIIPNPLGKLTLVLRPGSVAAMSGVRSDDEARCSTIVGRYLDNDLEDNHPLKF